MQDRLNPVATVGASLTRRGDVEESLTLRGVFTLEHIRQAETLDMMIARLKRGELLDEHELLWLEQASREGLNYNEEFPNTVVTVGKNLMLSSALQGSAYTVTGPFMFLISSTGYSAIVAADTMASHAGWTEAGNANTPTYTAPRKTAVFSAPSAGAIALSAALSFAITGTGTIKGSGLTYGTGAVSTIDNTGGTLFSAGLFTGGDRAVLNGDTVNVSYSCSL